MVASKPIERLKKSAEFSRLKNEGRKVRVSSWLLLSFEKNELKILRYGTTVPRKIGTAVVRNKLKRWVKAFIYSSSEFHTLEVDINFVFLPTGQNCSKLKFAEVFEEFHKGLMKIKRYLRTDPAEQTRKN